ncbi:hypothetical protein GCM10007918_10960 [Piscinibacter gummiphilus]|nr:hypothetical protein GCM10007918_10960 [Piscinibacter gummiphilus]
MAGAGVGGASKREGIASSGSISAARTTAGTAVFVACPAGGRTRGVLPMRGQGDAPEEGTLSIAIVGDPGVEEGRGRPEPPGVQRYWISDMTSCDMLLDCLSIEVPACISICLEVMLAVSVA